MEQPTHGTERNKREQTDVTYTEYQVPGGRSFRAPMSSHTYTVTERWCEKCGAWVEAKGIIGALVCPECHAPWDKRYWEN